MYAQFLRHAAYDVDEAEDGREALAKAISRRPSVIVTETLLPGMDGFLLCELLRKDLSTQEIPIIVVTADAYPAHVAKAEQSGADIVLTKPCAPDVLLTEVRRCLGKSREVVSRAQRVREQAVGQLARSGREIDRSSELRARHPLTRSFQRHNTTSPPSVPPSLVCPRCDRPLVYQHSHIGGVSQRHSEQWDYYECPDNCGTFQYRQRTRKVRKLS